MGRFAALAVLCAVTLAACGTGRQEAQSIATAIRQLPGVASAESDYQSGWTGASRLALTVVLDPTATPPQGAELGRTVTELLDRNGFTGAHATLTVDYPATVAKSSARFSFDGPPSAVSDALGEWLDIARSAGVASVNWVDGLQVTVGPAATDGDLRGIAQKRPNVTWILIGLVDPLDSASRADLHETYEVRGMVPDQKLRDRWNQIVAELGAVGQVNARSQVGANPPTDVTVNIPTAYGDRSQSLAQAWMTFPLLQGLPLPARVEFGGDVFTIGGCTPVDPAHAASNLEAELRQKFERC